MWKDVVFDRMLQPHHDKASRAMGFHMCTKGGEISCYWGLTRHLSSGTTSARREKVPTQVTRNPTEERGMRSVALAYYIIVRMN